MCNFAKDDVIKLAQAIVKNPLEYSDGDFTPYYYCIYCDATHTGFTKASLFIHDLDCPVLIAQDILTSFK